MVEHGGKAVAIISPVIFQVEFFESFQILIRTLKLERKRRIMEMEKTKKLMVGISATAVTLSLAGCGSSTSSLPPKPTDKNCNDWDWSEEDGVWQCDESGSGYYRFYHYGGSYYHNKSSLHSSSDYINYKNSASFKTTKSSSGFGSGSKSFGG